MKREEKSLIPLAERMRPQRLEDFVGQDHIVGPNTLLGRALSSGRIFPVIFWGPPGSGKTTLARLVARYTALPFRSFSAVTSGLKELREVVTLAEHTLGTTGKPTLLFVDEIHRFNKAQQDAFLPHVESGLIVLVGATTQNPSFELIPPLLSRTRVLLLKALDVQAIKKILNRAIHDEERGLGSLKVKITPEALDILAASSGGDARVALNNLEALVLDVTKQKGQEEKGLLLDVESLAHSIETRPLLYDKEGEEHYNIISAFHKSLRGGDVQASLYWLYRMLEAGEDPLFIARRMIRVATEDVGLADPQALQVAVAAFEAFERVGSPEGELALAEAAAYLALAPKSNALYLAEKEVREEIKRTGTLPVPLHIRNAPTKLMKKLGYGKGYLYPHNHPGGKVEQEYLPQGLRKKLFYRPTDRGFEGRVLKNFAPHKRGPDD